jgi:hypothetical protein
MVDDKEKDTSVTSLREHVEDEWKLFLGALWAGMVAVVGFLTSCSCFWNATFDSPNSPIYRGKGAVARTIDESSIELFWGVFFLVSGLVGLMVSLSCLYKFYLIVSASSEQES